VDGFLTKFLAGQIFNDPLVSKLFMLFIFFVGSAQVIKWIHSWWKTGKLKVVEAEQDKQQQEESAKVESEKGQWKKVMEDVLKETKIRNDRADKIHEMVEHILAKTIWLANVHDKVDDEGRYVWYGRKSLEITIDKLSLAIESQTRVMDRMWGEIKDTRHDLNRLEDRLPSKRD